MKNLPGTFFINIHTLFWGVYPFVTVALFQSINPLFAVCISTFFAAVFFCVLMVSKKTVGELKNKKLWKDMVLSGVFLSAGFYGFYFWGLAHSNAGNAALFGLTEVFFSFLFFNIWKKEQMTAPHILGAFLVLSGAFTLLFFQHFGTGQLFSFNPGDIILILANIFCPFGNYFMKRAKQYGSTYTILFGRNFSGFLLLLVITFIFSDLPRISDIVSVIPLLFINGFVFLGLAKIFWLEGVHRISVTRAASIDALAPMITLIIGGLFFTNMINIWQWIACIPMVLGVWMLIKPSANK